MRKSNRFGRASAEGKSFIHNVYQIERGYEKLVPRLVALGARIKAIEED